MGILQQEPHILGLGSGSNFSGDDVGKPVTR